MSANPDYTQNPIRDGWLWSMSALLTTVDFRFARDLAGNQNRTSWDPRLLDESASSYSPRKASMGSVLVARLAGSAEAASASSSIAMAESASTPGSNGLISNRKERNKRDAATAPSKPKPQPTAASLAPELRMTSISPERWQPSAMRTAISCSRNATENAITP